MDPFLFSMTEQLNATLITQKKKIKTNKTNKI